MGSPDDRTRRPRAGLSPVPCAADGELALRPARDRHEVVAMRCCCGCLALALLLLVAGAGVAAAYAGSLPSVSQALGADRPRDLGVRWTSADYESVFQKAPIRRSSAPEFHCLNCPTSYGGRIAVSDRFTDREISAWLSVQNAAYGPIRDVQVRFNDDGIAELSGMLVEWVRSPVYARARVTPAATKAIRLDFDRIELGRLQIPQPALRQASDVVSGLVNDKLGHIDGLEIQDLKVQAGGLTFRGSLPQTAKGAPPEG